MTATYLRRLHQPRRPRVLRAVPQLGRLLGQAGSGFLDHRLAAYEGEQRMVFGATTFRMFAEMLPAFGDERDPWLDRMLTCPTTVISSTLEGPFDWPDATVARGDGVEIVRRKQEESDVPIRSHGSLSLNRALMVAGLVDRVQFTVFPVVAGQTGGRADLRGAATSPSTCEKPAPSTAAPRSWCTGTPSVPSRSADSSAGERGRVTGAVKGRPAGGRPVLRRARPWPR